MKAAYGRVTTVRDYASLGVTRVVIELAVESHIAATDLLYGQDVLVTLAPADLKGTPYGIRDSDGPDPKPAEKSGHGITQMAGILCKDPAFQHWLDVEFKKGRLPGMANLRNIVDTSIEGWTAQVVRRVCGIESRAELDRDPQAAMCFEAWLRKPFTAHQAQA